MKHEVESLEREIAAPARRDRRLTADRGPAPHRPRRHRADRPRGARPGQAGRARPQAAAAPGGRCTARWSCSSRPLRRRALPECPRGLQAGPGLEGHADHACASCATPMPASTRCPREEALEREPRAPVFLHLVPAYQEPDIAGTVTALVRLALPARAPARGGDHQGGGGARARIPRMGVSTGELVRRLRETLPPYQQKRLIALAMPGPGRKAHQLNWALRPEALREILGEDLDPRRVFVGVSDADSIPGSRHLSLDRPARSSAGHGSARLPGHHALPRQLRPARRSAGRSAPSSSRPSSSACRSRGSSTRSSACGSSRASPRAFPRLGRCSARLRAVLPPLADLPRPQPVRAPGHARSRWAAFPPRAPPRTPRWAMRWARRGILIQALPMVELTDLPETSEKVIRQNARWYLGVLDDIPFLWRTWRAEPTAFNLAQLAAPRRQQGGRVADRRAGLSGHGLARLVSRLYVPRGVIPCSSTSAIGAPTLSLLLTVWVGGIMTQSLIEELRPYLPRAVDLAPQELQGEVPRHVPLSDLLAARHARRLARALEPRRDRALRGGEDGSRAERPHARARARRIRRRD